MLRRALQIALDAGDAENAGWAYANLHSMLLAEMRLAESIRCYDEGVVYTDEHDIATYYTCLRGWHAVALDRLGCWDEASEILARPIPRRSAVNHGPTFGGHQRTERDPNERGLAAAIRS